MINYVRQTLSVSRGLRLLAFWLFLLLGWITGFKLPLQWSGVFFVLSCWDRGIM